MGFRGIPNNRGRLLQDLIEGSKKWVLGAMDFDAQQQVQPQISGSERLMWAGRPKRGLLLRREDVFVIPVSILWCGMAISFAVAAHSSGAPWFFDVVALFFVAVGLHFVLGRFIHDALFRRCTYYGISSERVIIVTTLFGRRVRSLNLRTLTDLSLSEGSGGRGTITFGQASSWGWWHAGAGFPGMGPDVPRFDTISDAKRVYDILLQVQRGAS